MRGVIDLKLTGKRIHDMCEFKKLTTEVLAEMMMLSDRRIIYYWYSGEKLPSIDNIYMLSRILGTTVDNLFIERKEDNAMEKMLVTQALDEKDLLLKKINDKIQKASFVEIIKHNEEKTSEKHIDRDVYSRDAEAAYQQINDLIARYQKIEIALVASNAATMVETTYGTFTVAGAIALRARLKGLGTDGADFEGSLCNKMKDEYDLRIQLADRKNKQLQETAEQMRLSILGKDTKIKDDKPLEVVETYVRENTTELLDPIKVAEKIEALKEKTETLLRELDTQIKVSNATTFIEI